jgi:hypothetical protein
MRMSFALVLCLIACAPPAPEPVAVGATGEPARAAAPRLENRVWARVDSAGRPTGELYTFLGEGTLVIASAAGTPMLGAWSRAGSGLTLVEDGVGYDTDIVHLRHGELLLRSHNPGGTLDLRFVPADTSHP